MSVCMYVCYFVNGKVAQIEECSEWRDCNYSCNVDLLSFGARSLTCVGIVFCFFGLTGWKFNFLKIGHLTASDWIITMFISSFLFRCDMTQSL